MRTFEISRKTAETDIFLSLNLDGTGKSSIDTGCGFLNHMLTLFAAHGKFDLTVKCAGDIDVDDHHSVEDIGIVLGQAFSEALDRMGVSEVETKTFDPNLHNAVMHIDSEELEENTISQVFQKGFKIGDKVVRFAMVQVAN